VEEPYDHATARDHIRAILDGPGMTTFSQGAKDAMMDARMLSGDVVNRRIVRMEE
jgi:hypothetical protein